MSTPNDKKRQQPISKLKELFQLDQPDLDFGLYRAEACDHTTADSTSASRTGQP